MAITGVQLIYRLKDTVRLLIDYRTGSPPPDFFNFYWSSTELGVYTVFATNIINEPNQRPSVRGKIIFEFKPSTITNQILKYSLFMVSDCEKKRDLAWDYKIDYIYSNQFNCTGFDFVDRSSEGLYLYEVKFS